MFGRVETEQQARLITELREELRIEKENLAPLQSTGGWGDEKGGVNAEAAAVRST